jgi:gamma-glutamylcyclotransferase (GGCT)/AIG2-like uncharacterized protein YtfP
MRDDVDHLFVYGTLRPGDVRWHLLEPYVVGSGTDDAVHGTVFDTGRGYPAAIFGGAGTIRGRTYALDRRRLDQALGALDAEESSVPGGYTRTIVTTLAGVTAWSYRYGEGLELTAIESGDWLSR